MSRTSGSGPDSTTVVLVHGAFADSSGWNGVIERLHDAGVRCVAVSNPLRGVAHDAGYVRSAIEQIDGQVLAVGHSYGGAVITNAAAGVDKVVGLVFVAGFMPEEGESLAQIESNSRDSVLSSALTEGKYPAGTGETAVELAIDPDQFHDAFARDLPLAEARVMAATQRPIAAAAFGEPTATPAWKSTPSWAIVPTGDRAAGSDVLLTMAERAGATITTTPGSHVIMISNPQAVTDVVMQALDSVG